MLISALLIIIETIVFGISVKKEENLYRIVLLILIAFYALLGSFYYGYISDVNLLETKQSRVRNFIVIPLNISSAVLIMFAYADFKNFGKGIEDISV